MNSYVNENSTCYLPCTFHCAKSLAYEPWARFGCDFARLFGCADTVVVVVVVVVVVFVSLWAAESDLIAGRAVSRACTPCPHSLRLTHSVSLSFSLPSLPLVLYFVGLTRAKSVRAQRTMLSTNCYSDACVRSAKTKPRLCFHFSLNNNNSNNSRNWKTKKLPSSEKRQIIITNTSTTRLCVSETRKSNRRNGKKQNVENKNWLEIGIFK